MIEKFGIVAVGVTAGLMAAAPFASAVEAPEAPEAPISGEGNDGQLFENNVFHQHNFEGNTLNGEEVDNPFADVFGADDLPSAEDGDSGFGGGIVNS